MTMNRQLTLSAKRKVVTQSAAVVKGAVNGVKDKDAGAVAPEAAAVAVRVAADITSLRCT